ncbi:MAG: VanZ family protein [Candidatus Eisenbacteria bacterium]
MRPETERRILAWVPAVVYVALIFAVSSIPGSLHGIIPFRVFDKVAHIVEFTGLGLFLTVAFRGTLPRASMRNVVLLVLVVGLSIGLLDELYQHLVPGRAVEFLDWVADTIGVVAGSTVAVIHYRRRGGTWSTGEPLRFRGRNRRVRRR